MNIKVIVVPQHSKVEQFLSISYDWTTYKHNFRPFDEVAVAFPQSVKEVAQGATPPWGSAFYKKGAEGKVELLSENWDTSG